MKLEKIPKSNMDYVEVYALNIKKNKKLFKDQKKFIESQIKGSSSIFLNSFGKGDIFKIRAREYLKQRQII